MRGPHEGEVGVIIQKWAAMVKIRKPMQMNIGHGSGVRVIQVKAADVVPIPLGVRWEDAARWDSDLPA